jgi:hypothetical protein
MHGVLGGLVMIVQALFRYYCAHFFQARSFARSSELESMLIRIAVLKITTRERSFLASHVLDDSQSQECIVFAEVMVTLSEQDATNGSQHILTEDENWFFLECWRDRQHFDSSHKSRRSNEVLEYTKARRIFHPRDSQDASPSDFFFFAYLKRQLSP